MASGPIIEASLGLDTTQFQRGLINAEKAAVGFQGALSKFAGITNFFSTGLAALGIGRVFDAAFASANEASRAAIEAGREVDALTAATLRSEAAFRAAGKAAGDLAKFVVGNLALIGEQFTVTAGNESPQSSGFIDRLREAASTQDLATVQQMATQRARELDERIAEFDRREAEIDLGPVAFSRPAQETRAARRAFLVDEARRELAAIALALRSAEQEEELAAERFVNGGAELFRELALAAEQSSEQFRSEMERINREAEEDTDAKIERLSAERERMIALGESGQAEDSVRLAEEVRRITEEIRDIEGERYRRQQEAAKNAKLDAEIRRIDAQELADIERQIADLAERRAELASQRDRAGRISTEGPITTQDVRDLGTSVNRRDLDRLEDLQRRARQQRLRASQAGEGSSAAAAALARAADLERRANDLESRRLPGLTAARREEQALLTRQVETLDEQLTVQRETLEELRNANAR